MVGLAFVHVLSLASFGTQLEGLVGSNGILPASTFVGELERALGSSAFGRAPTVALLTGASDVVLHLHVVVGLLLAGLLALDVAPFVATFGLYLVALSIQIVGQDFLAFQWDLLLVETTFLAVFLSPPFRFLPTSTRLEPPRLAIVLLRLLFARFLFASGVVKLTSGDPTWRDLTALSFHYETTCLPSILGYLAHALPLGIHRLAALAMFVIELGAPFLVFGSATMRRSAFVASVLLQVVIGLTGNYGFFNVLTVVLSFVVLDDADLRAFATFLARRRRAPEAGPSVDEAATSASRAAGRSTHVAPRTRPASRATNVLAGCAAALYVPLAFAPLAWSFRAPIPSGGAYERFVSAATPFRVANAYGLFATMTTHRDEILVEGSRDGVTWQPYTLPYEPGPLDRAPPFAGFHMPRLDWLMWFAALGDAYDSGFFVPFVKRLLEGSHEVRALLARDPFGDTPPRYVRARIARYHFTTLGELRKTGEYWKRDAYREYLPPMTLANGELRFASVAE